MDEALDRGDVDTANSELESAFESKGLTLGELSWLWAMQARIAGLRGDKEQQLIAVRQALAVSDEWIPEKLRAGLLTTQVLLEIEEGNYSAAIGAYSALKAVPDADTSELDPLIERIQALVESDQLLFQAAEIGSIASCATCASRWRYKPLRRTIEITDIDGKLENLEVRCEWQRYVDQARGGIAWTIPDSWGECSVVVYGETGSTFKLVELPAS